MKNKEKLLLFSCLSVMLLIMMNVKTAVAGAKSGMELCLYTIIPALFPYCVLSVWLRSMLSHARLMVLSPVEKFLNMPQGTGIFLVLGLLGGYPMGALCIEQAIESNEYERKQIKFLSGICNNAGPSFILGIISFSFNSTRTVVLLFIIQIASALITCVLLSDYIKPNYSMPKKKVLKLTDAIKKATTSISSVCATVILFKTILAIINNYAVSMINNEIYIIIIGLLELTNGSTLLGTIPNENLRFIIATAMSCFGGMCVHMQTMLISAPGVYKYYFTSVLTKTLISVFLSLFYIKTQSIIALLTLVTTVIIIVKNIKIIICKKTVAINNKVQYNKIIRIIGGCNNALQKKTPPSL